MIYVLGIDPGVTTGWSLIGVSWNSVYGNAKGKIQLHEQGQTTGPFTGQAIELCGIARHNRSGPLAMVIEDFEPRSSNRSDDYLSPVKLGAMLTYAVMRGDAGAALGPFWQMPGTAKATATDGRLKLWSLYTPGSVHARDATRHAITFIRRAKADETLRAEAWGRMINGD